MKNRTKQQLLSQNSEKVMRVQNELKIPESFSLYTD